MKVRFRKTQISQLTLSVLCNAEVDSALQIGPTLSTRGFWADFGVNLKIWVGTVFETHRFSIIFCNSEVNFGPLWGHLGRVTFWLLWARRSWDFGEPLALADPRRLAGRRGRPAEPGRNDNGRPGRCGGVGVADPQDMGGATAATSPWVMRRLRRAHISTFF